MAAADCRAAGLSLRNRHVPDSKVESENLKVNLALKLKH